MKVKICGMTDPRDAEYAAQVGADYIGIIFAAQSKRKVLVPAAKEIALAANIAGADPIAVFVDETADEIISICRETRIYKVQLHGQISKQALNQLMDQVSIIYAIPVATNGVIVEGEMLPPTVTILYDNLNAGSGKSFDWTSFNPTARRWMLAGGLNPDNVAAAIALLKPFGVDVATGVEYSNSVRKDPALVKAFIEAAKSDKEIT